MGFFQKNKKAQRTVESLASSERDAMIRRLERERKKVNAEIEGILKSYAKESGNKALKRKRFGRKAVPNDFDFSQE